MVSILVAWVNTELELGVSEKTLDASLASGFVLGALLHRHNQLPGHHKLRRRDSPDAKIQNFCLLEPALNKLGIKFDAALATKIMEARPGTGAMVLYQMKMKLDALKASSCPVSVRWPRDGVQPLPNLPHRASKPQYDAAKGRIFERAVRERAENPNDIMVRRHLRKFVDRRKLLEAQAERERLVAINAHEKARDASRKARLYLRSQEAAFLKTWEERGEEEWKRLREERAAIVKQREQRAAKRAEALERRKQTAKAKMQSAVADDLDAFEAKLNELAPAPAERLLPTIQVGDETVLDARKLDEAFRSQVKKIREVKAERDESARRNEMRRRKFLAERREEMLQRCYDRQAEEFEKMLTRKCKAEIELEKRLADIANYADRMNESRQYHEQQYKARVDVDAENAMRRDGARLEQDVAAYELEVDAYSAIRSVATEARAAASRKAHEETCLELVRLTVALALEVADLRSAEMPAPEYQGLRFEPSHSTTVDEAPVHDAIRLLARKSLVLKLGAADADPALSLVAASAAFGAYYDDEEDKKPAAGAKVVAVAAVPPSVPPGWPPVDQLCEEATADPEAVETLLDSWDLDEYLTNAPPAWFSPELERVERGGGLNGIVGGEGAEDAPDHAIGEAVIEVRAAATDLRRSPPLALPPEFPLRICLVGRTYSGKSSQAARLAERFHLKVLSVSSLLEEAMETSEAAALGRIVVFEDDEDAELRRLGRAARGVLRGGGAISDDMYAGLVAAGVARLARKNNNHDNNDDARCDGWILDDFPETASQAAALEKALTGYDAYEHAPSRWDFASPLAQPRPKPEPKWPGSSPPLDDHDDDDEEEEKEFVTSGVDFVFILGTTVDDALRRALGRRVDSDEDGENREYHLEWNQPDYDEPCKARLVPIEDPANPTACLPLQIAAHDAAALGLRTFLERFGTAREISVDPKTKTQDEIFELIICPVVEELVAARAPDEQKAAEERAQRDAERAARLATLEAEADAATAQAAAAAAASDERDDTVARGVAATAAAALAEAARSAIAGHLVEEAPRCSPSSSAREKKLPQALAETLASAWNATEAAYCRGARGVFRAMRAERTAALARLYAVRADFARFLARPDDRQTALERFIAEYNRVPRAMRGDDSTKAEFHLRVEELRAAMWTEVEARRDDATAALEALEADGAVERRSLAASRNFAALVQLEVDRTHAALMLLYDYAHVRYPHLAADADETVGGAKVGCWGRLAKICAYDDDESSAKRPSFSNKKAADSGASDGRQPLPPDVLVGDLLFPDDEAKKKQAQSSKKKSETTTTTTPLDGAVAAALEFAGKWRETAQRLEVAAVEREAALLEARVERIRDVERRAVVAIEARSRGVLAELAEWRDARVRAEAAVVEEVVARARDLIEKEKVLEDEWVVDGIVLRVDPSSKLVPLGECEIWTTHPRAHQLLIHAAARAALPEPPPPPEPLDLPETAFADHQILTLRTAFDSAASNDGVVTYGQATEILQRLALTATALPKAWQRAPGDAVAASLGRVLATLDPPRARGVVSVDALVDHLHHLASLQQQQ
ncbi:hypothetical protein CTAYLR_001056 [Chrysophaeum taylorii]|uniref:Calponin-homology (CH) domain-containing protein n=1 Tax=Chrysophaeum taylorii TaxID=2483200 RepID=A0AAD7UFM7_9STRA|nr:hypothetical protein CTAYLR_001056 [Chrysophaeum taylorii]